jgi:hypothetical protein
MNDQILNVAISSCLGLTSAVGLGTGGPNGGVRRVECVRFRIDGEGYESPFEGDDEDADNLTGANVRETFDVHFGISFGGMVGEWTAKGLSVSDGGAGLEDAGAKEAERQEVQPTTAAGWKAKFLEAQRKLWEKDEEARGLKEKILEAVL